MAVSQFARSEPPPTAGHEGKASLRGRLEGERAALAVRVAEASRVSLWVWFDGERPGDGTEFERLRIESGGVELVLGRCRFAADPWDGADGRLVFLDDVYDCGALIRDGVIVNVRAFFRNLTLVLSQREQVQGGFKAFVADAMFDLSAYKRFFDEQEAFFATESREVAELARRALVRCEHPRFFAFVDAQMRGMEELIAGFTREEHERHGFYFRRQAWPYIVTTDVLRQINVKPRGYAGDADAMVMIYRDEYSGRTAFNQLLHKYSVNTSAAHAVRFRRHHIPRVMREVQATFAGLPPHGFGVLSLACGPAWELEDVLAGPEDFERLHIGLLDQDAYALGVARATVERVEAQRGGSARVRYFQDSVRTMLRDRDLRGRFGPYHFIYSMGLFDYLTPPVARAVLAKTYELLLPGGTLLVGNYHERNSARLYMEYWGDWPLYYRSEQSLLDLASGLKGERQVSFDPSGSQMFLRLDKPA
ncbi:MAG TPA: class I SAM-dependent methyltransferase [Anaeromyxobacteraceae bacterium]|nr:class I SAM-dependent methyltransferase [Anaeromyxobacteraceae bacterium]